MVTQEALTIIATLSGIAGTAILFLWRLFRFTNRFLDEQTRVKESLVDIKKELTPNGGSSIKDVVVSLKLSTDRIENRQKKIDQRSKAALHYTTAALFEIDEDGKIMWANEAFSLMTKNSKLVGYDWFSLVDEEYRKDFIEEVNSCLKMNRKIEIETKCCQGKIIHFTGYPYQVGESIHEGFLIHIYKGEEL